MSTKVTMNLSDESMENIQMIQRLSHASNQTTAVAIALNIARTILEEEKKGSHIYFEKGDYIQKLIFDAK